MLSTKEIFAAKGEMAARMRALDWSETSLGAAESWPQSLRTALSICLNSSLAICLHWGPDHTLLYNDAWIPIAGDRHPWSLGRPARQVWSETVCETWSALDRAFRFGEPFLARNRNFAIQRQGRTEECCLDMSISPIRGEDGVVTGVFSAALETACRVTAERRSLLLKKLAEETAAPASADGAFGAGAVMEFALNRVHEAVYLTDAEGCFLSVNDEAVRALGYSRDELLAMTVLDICLDWTQRKWKEHWLDIKSQGSRTLETLHCRKNGTIFPVEVTANYFEYDGGAYDLGLVRDITERRLAEQEHDAHLRFFESMDRVNRAMHKTSDLEQTTRDVLDVVLDIFDCDRAYLAYPCDPEAAFWSTPIERTRPEYPRTDGGGAVFRHGKFPVCPELAAMCRLLLASDRPVKFGPGSDRPLPAVLADRFGVKSKICMALRPKVGKPWVFGLHQCSYPRAWTPAEEKLLEEIGRRLSDSLTSLLAHRDLCKSEARLREAQHLGHMGNWEYDLVNNELTWSDEIFDIFEIDRARTPASYEGYISAVHPEDRVFVTRAYNESVNSRTTYDIVHRLLMKDGRIKYLNERCETFYSDDGRPLRSVGTVLDITDRRRAEDALRLSEERYRTLAMANSAIVWTTNADGKVVEDAPSWRAFTGQSLEAIKGDGWMDAIHPDDYVRTVAVWRRAVETRAPFETASRVRRHDGEHRHLAVRGAPVLEEDGSVREWIGSCADVTERDRARKEAADYRRHLEMETAERKRAEEALFQAQKMEAIGRLTGGIAHDFNNLLTVIRGNLDLVLARIPNGSPMRRFTRNALAAVERAAETTAKLLAFSRKQHLVTRPINVNAVVRDMIGLLRQTIGERIAVELQLPPDLPPAMADRHQLESALLNLVINARDAMPEGGRLTIATGWRVIAAPDAAGLAPGRYVALTVTDTGCGVPSELAARIFEPFFTTKEVGKGTGLGLSMIYGFTRQSGGAVSVTNAPGGGARFTICLPCAPATSETRTPAPAPDDVQEALGERRDRRRILIVEDEASVREVAAAILRDLGYDVTEAADAAAAIDILQQRQDIDLMFTDMVMPGQTGAELAAIVHSRWPAIPILLTTGYARAFKENGLPPGVGILSKPYHLDDLTRRVQSLLGGTALEDRSARA